MDHDKLLACIRSVFARKIKQIDANAENYHQKKFALSWLRKAEIDLIQELGIETERKTTNEQYSR